MSCPLIPFLIILMYPLSMITINNLACLVPCIFLFTLLFRPPNLATAIPRQANSSRSVSVGAEALCEFRPLLCENLFRMKIVHTSTRLIGQIYILVIINWFLMVMCLIVVAPFRSATDIANAYVFSRYCHLLTSINR